MDFEIIGFTEDFRTNTPVLYVQITISDYLEWVGADFSETEFQRKREKHKAYKKMKEDIQKGAVLPPITLALKPEYIQKDLLEAINSQDKDKNIIINELSQKNRLFILDGLQRTYILQDLKKEYDNQENSESRWKQQKLLVEIWLEKELSNLIYRFFVLNTGQKAMTPRHQLDVIFSGLKKVLEDELEIELFSEKDTRRRTKFKQFKTKDVATSYACFSLKDYAPDKDNLIVQQMQDEKLLLATDMDKKVQNFKTYLKEYAELDELCFRYYQNETTGEAKHFFGSEYLMNAFFALVGEFLEDEDSQHNMEKALQVLKENIYEESDVFGVEIYQEIKTGFSASKKNLGLIYKQIIYTVFQKFFNKAGKVPLRECWTSLRTNGKITLHI